MTNDEKMLGYLRKVTADLKETRRRLEQVEAAGTEPVAIVGMACRFPGGVATPAELGDLVERGVDALSDFPADRGWRLDGDWGGVPVGGFLSGAGQFDAGFFGISPREALAMDPQQRHALECSWEALEDAGVDPLGLSGSETGVFLGTNGQDYADLLGVSEEVTELGGFAATGNIASVISGRVAYALDLSGPTMSVDTACSSSLVALHLAAQALRRGECSLALAGGVTVMSTPAAFAEFARQGGLASDGRCKAFAEAADGTGWGEGVGVLVVERLSDARAKGHRVLALVRGSAVNSDGASNGLTAPNGPSQQRVIRAALADAGLEVSDVDAVEAHGTGTRLGDPIEAQALLATYGQDRDRPLWLGSVKSNIGHTQAAAGVAGVVKMVEAMRRGVLPATLHVDAPTSQVDWTAGGVEVLAEAREWPGADRPRRAGVSAFGISGTNAHVILEQAPAEASSVRGDTNSVVPWVVSGRDDAGVVAQASGLAAGLSTEDSGSVVDVGWSLATERAALDERAVVIGADRAELLAGLESLTGAVRGRVSGDGRVGVVFSGQGAQRAGMGRELAERFPVFARALDEIDAVLPVREVMFSGDSLDETGVTQPVLFAFEVALYRLLESFGIAPAVVMGHSVGEIVAAHVAGVVSLGDACTLVSARASLMQALPSGGAMVSLQATVDEVEPLLAGEALVSIAAVNAADAVVISGDVEAVERIAATVAGWDRKTTRLTVSHAFHSPLMDPMLDEFARAIAGVRFTEPTMPLLSNLTGALVTPGLVTDPGYWVRHVREPVRFADGVAALDADVLVEIGPKAALAGMVARTTTTPVTATGRKGVDEPTAVLTALANLWVHGTPIDWTPAYTGLHPRHTDLPTRAFTHTHYWPTVRSRTDAAEDGTRSLPERKLWELVECEDVPAVARLLGEDGESGELARFVSSLGSWRRNAQESSLVGSWSYGVRWVARSLPRHSLGGRWVVVTGGAGISADALADALTARGADVTVVDLAAGVTRETTASLLPGDVADADGVVCLTGSGTDEAVGTLWELVVLVQALADREVHAPLWTITHGGATVGLGDAVSSPVAAGLWGLGRVAALERGGAWGGLIDVPAVDETSAADWQQAVDVLAGGATGEREIAVRPHGAFVRRLVRSGQEHRAPEHDGGLADIAGGTVLVTGGAGALGSRVVAWLAERRVARIVLLGRSGVPDHVLANLRDAIPDGVEINTVACDVADRPALDRVVEEITLTGPPLCGVVHAAGVVANALLVESTWDDFVDVVRAKVVGGRNLHEATRHLDLRLFVTFSSIAATWGSAGQAAYAAGNAFLDGLVGYRHGLGLTGTSIAWGPWAGGGMAADPDAARHMHDRGLNQMEPDIALSAFGRAMWSGESPTVIADVDWSRLAAVFDTVGVAKVFQEIPEARAVLDATVAAPAGEESGFAAELRALPPAERQLRVVELIRAQAAQVLGHRDSSGVDIERPFTDLGFDSLSAVEFRNRLGAATGVALAAATVFDFPTPRKLAAHLLARWEERDEPEAPAPVALALDEPVAIVGMACRLPGGVRTPEDLWKLVDTGGDGIGSSPSNRGWPIRTTGGFIDGADEFDPGFFGISPREALSMDPQQRLVLECSWEALERAAIDPVSLRGTDTGVFMGASYSAYQAFVEASEDEAAKGYGLTGSAPSVVSGRVAYALGLEGPALSVDTACSSSLVALHLATRALQRGECSLALAGGVTVMATPGAFVEFGKQGGLAADGRCKAFSDDADGTGWSEGVGVLAVERLSDALARGHRVLAVVRGSAVNSDGASNGLTAPNGPSQQRVIRAALADAGLDVSDVDVVEAHGTGTKLGDPIEAQALLATYGRRRDERPLLLGTVKSNIGHTQAAAGVAGVIKMAAALEHGTLPRTLHVGERSSRIDWSAGDVELLTEPRPWPVEAGRPRRAGVSAFGISGTNAHVVLEEAPEIPAPSDVDGSAAGVPWVFSAANAETLRAQADLLAGETEKPVLDVGWTLARSRAGLAHRAVVLGEDRDELAAGLRLLSAGDRGPNLVTGTPGPGTGATAVVFSGQGSQRAGMGRELYERYPVFAEALDEVCGHFDVQLDHPLREVMFAGEDSPLTGLVGQTAYAQPALFAHGVALWRLLESWGVRADYLLGHSIGEITAAHVAGLWSLPDACRLVGARGRLMQALPSRGAMVSLQAGKDEIVGLLDGITDRVSLAAVNAPDAVVVSGDADLVSRIAGEVEGWGRKIKHLRVSHAFHSPRMDAMLDEFTAVAADVEYHRPRLPLVSNLTGALADPDYLCRAQYWVLHVRQPVLFADGIADLLGRGATRFVEVGPDAVLSPAMTACADPAAEVRVTELQRRDRPEARTLQTGIARLYTQGVDVDWPAVVTASGATPRQVDLPTYPFERDRYWPLAEPAAAGSGSAADAAFWGTVGTGDPERVADALGVTSDDVRAIVPALARWRRDADENAAVDACRYQVDWQPVRSRSAAPTGPWLIVTTETGDLAERIADELRPGGPEVRILRLGGDELDGEALRKRLSGELGPDGLTVLSLLGDVDGDHPSAPAVRLNLAATTELVRALCEFEEPGKVVALTRGAVRAVSADAAPDPAQAQLWGFGRVVALEHPERWAGLVDIPRVPDRAVLARLRSVLFGGYEGDQLAVRDAGVHARRLVQRPAPAPARSWKPRGTVLVSGGTGAIGVAVARWLASQGAEHILLLSRGGAGRVPGLADELGDTGLTVASCDVADRDALAAVLAEVPSERPLSAVFHAAGVGEACLLGDLDLDELALVTGAKVRGADNLDELTREMPLDAFVLFSSIAGVWGSGAQGAYAAGNAYLDALAERRRAAGLTATAVAWGPWARAGMATEGDAAEQLSKRGLNLIEPDLAIAALAKAIDLDDTATVFADVAWPKFLPLFTAARESDLFDELPGVRAAVAEAAPAPAADGDFAALLAGLSEQDRRRTVLDLVRTTVARVLGFGDVAKVAPSQAFKELGFDSLTAVELRTELAGATGLTLPASLVFDHPTPAALADHLLRALGADESGVETIVAGLDRLFGALAEADLAATDRLLVERRLADLTRQVRGERPAEQEEREDLGAVSDDELFDAIESELGR
ncbi:hypothetical protein GCM10009754_21380 [Amycolatopsis minnesotensis]|uniref:Acyl transferase domain-containing protein n=1 Tax=Amycolatopsis minnesotensis TaxID=337894 RepID=A0ABN2QGU9_9PSEU